MLYSTFANDVKEKITESLNFWFFASWHSSIALRWERFFRRLVRHPPCGKPGTF